MTTIHMRFAGLVLGLTMLAAGPTNARAQLFHNWSSGSACGSTAVPATSLLPATAAPCAPQVVQYMPQTSYRAQVCNVPVTTYRPVCSLNPCTGCQQTALRPVTTYVQQTRLIPYNSYRLVYSAPTTTVVAAPVVQRSLFGSYTTLPAARVVASPVVVAPVGVASAGCATCAGPAYPGSPGAAAAMGGTVIPAPSLSPITTQYAPTTTYIPSTSYQQSAAYQPAPGYQPSTAYPSSSTYQPTTSYTPAPTYQPAPAYTPAPAYAPAPSYAPSTSTPPPAATTAPPAAVPSTSPSTAPSTFRNEDTTPDTKLKPIPDNGVNGSPASTSTPPRLIDPENRVTAKPLYPAGSYTPVVWQAPADAPAAVAMPSQGGNVVWRGSNR